MTVAKGPGEKIRKQVGRSPHANALQELHALNGIYGR